MSSPEKQEADWADRPEVRKKLWIAMWVISGLTLVAEVILRLVSKHPHAGPFPFFYGVMGFVSCVAMIYIAKAIGYLVKKKPAFYGEEEESDA